MQGRFGFDSKSSDNLQLDAGQVIANFDIEAFLTDAQDTETEVTDLSTYGLNSGEAYPLGATDGGVSFTANRDIKEIDFDGALGRTKGMRRRDASGVNPELSADFLEFNQENLENAVVGYKTVDVEGEVEGDITGVVEITGDEITDDSYLKNVVFITMRSDGKPVIVELRNCLVNGDLDIDTDHGDESTITITFEGHFDVEECETGDHGEKLWIEPWRIVMYEDAA